MANRQTNGFTESLQAFKNKVKSTQLLSKKKLLVGWVDGSKDKKGNPYAVIARTLEYGRMAGVSRKGRKYPAIPSRDFVGQFYSRFSETTKKQMRKALKQLHEADKVTINDIDLALKGVGVFAIGDLQKTIVRGDYQANAPATIERWLKKQKGSKIKKAIMQNPRLAPTSGKKPLIDTGALQQHITYKIV